MTRLRYSERPIEWRNYAWSSWTALCLVGCLGAWRGKWAWSFAGVFGLVGLGAMMWAWGRPSDFRGWYRAGRWIGHQIGRVTGMVSLFVVFCVVVWPTGLFLRLIGKTPFSQHPDRREGTYWTGSKPMGDLDRLF